MKTFLTTTFVLAVLFFLAENNVPHMQDVANQELQRYTFEPLAFAMYFVTGLICLSPSHYRGKITRFIESHSIKLQIAYQASAGSILGWGTGTGAGLILKTGLDALPLVIAICCLFMLLALGPLWIYESAGGLAMQYRQFMLTERRYEPLLKFLGVMLIGMSGWGIGSWWLNG